MTDLEQKRAINCIDNNEAPIGTGPQKFHLLKANAAKNGLLHQITANTTYL